VLGRSRARARACHRLGVEIRAKLEAPAICGRQQTVIADEKDLSHEVGAAIEFSELLSRLHRPYDCREGIGRREHRSASVEDELGRRRV